MVENPLALALEERFEMKMKRLGHVAVCVEDVAKAAEFYQNLSMKLDW